MNLTADLLGNQSPDRSVAVVRSINPSTPEWSVIRLRRDGLPPLRFSGRLIARHEGKVPGVALWHDLALYRSASAAFAVEIVARLAASPDMTQPVADRLTAQPVRCHAALFGTLEDALTLLESHDASRDVCPGVSAPALGLDDPTLSPAVLMMQAAVLHGFCRDVVRRYRIGVGVLLANIGLQIV